MKEELKEYIKRNFEKEERNLFKSFVGSKSKCAYRTNLDESYIQREEYYDSNINHFINQHKDQNDFQTLLFKYIDDKNLKDSDVYNKVHLDRRLFSKIRSNSDYHPSKETVLLLGISLELTEEEITKLLESASYSLPKNNYYDLIMRFCFINKIYNLNTINDLLDEYHCKLFSI